MPSKQRARSVATTELGYAVSYPGNYWQIDQEATPELRWPLSSRVYELMRRQDAQVTSVLRAMTLPVRRSKWRIDANGARPEVAELVAYDLGLPLVGADQEAIQIKKPNRSKGRFSWAEHVQLAMLMIQYGHMFFEQVYRIDDTDGLAHIRKLAPRMPRTIASITVARDGGLQAISQYAMGFSSMDSNTGIAVGPGGEYIIPVERIVAYVNDREAGNWVGQSVLRPAYKHWVIKDRLMRVQAQTIERNGMGVPVYEAGELETDDDLANGQKLASSFRAGDAAGAALPFGAHLRLLGVEGQLPDADAAIRYHDEQIGRAVLAHFLNLGSSTGSWALGSTFADFFVMSLQTMAQYIADIANQHIIEDLVDINWGEDEPAPKLVFDEIGSQQTPVAAALKMLVDGGIIQPDRMLEAAVRQQYSLPMKDPDAPELEPKALISTGGTIDQSGEIDTPLQTTTGPTAPDPGSKKMGDQSVVNDK